MLISKGYSKGSVFFNNPNHAFYVAENGYQAVKAVPRTLSL